MCSFNAHNIRCSQEHKLTRMLPFNLHRPFLSYFLFFFSFPLLVPFFLRLSSHSAYTSCVVIEKQREKEKQMQVLVLSRVKEDVTSQMIRQRKRKATTRKRKKKKTKTAVSSIDLLSFFFLFSFLRVLDQWISFLFFFSFFSVSSSSSPLDSPCSLCSMVADSLFVPLPFADVQMQGHHLLSLCHFSCPRHTRFGPGSGKPMYI